MSKELIPFDYNGIPFRLIKDEQGEPWFVAKDVCQVLGYTNGSRDVQRHCKHAKLLRSAETVGLEINPRGILIFPESDLYRMVLCSDMPDAEPFQDWVAEEVLPQIRKTGGYIPVTPEMTPEQIMAQGYIIAMKTAEEQKKLLAAQHLKVDFCGEICIWSKSVVREKIPFN